VGNRSLGDLTEGRYFLLISSIPKRRRYRVQQQGVVVLVLFVLELRLSNEGVLWQI